MVKIRNLSKVYTEGGINKAVFTGLNLTIKKGEKIGLFGPNGSGKSTLLNIISGLDKDFAGTVTVNSQRIAYMHQDSNITLAPWFTSKRNILLGRSYRKMDYRTGLLLLDQLVQEFEVNFSLDCYPFQLSGGQKQLVALLRVLILEPDLLILDEPFAALDVKKRTLIRRYLKNHLKHKTLIISSHRTKEISTLVDRSINL